MAMLSEEAGSTSCTQMRVVVSDLEAALIDCAL